MSKRRLQQDEASETVKNQIIRNPVDHSKESEFYPKFNKHLVMGNSHKCFKQRNNMSLLSREVIWFIWI